MADPRVFEPTSQRQDTRKVQPIPGPSSRVQRANGPVRLPLRRGTAVSGPRWRGGGYIDTPARARELRDLRVFERAARDHALPNLERCVSSPWLVDRWRAGEVAPWSLRVLRDEDLASLGAKPRAVLAWLVAVHLGFRAEWLIARYTDVAELLDAAEITAARALRELVERGLVERMPLYDRVSVPSTDGTEAYTHHLRAPTAYRVPVHVLVRLGIDPAAIRAACGVHSSPDQNDQASEIRRDLSADLILGGDHHHGVPTPAPHSEVDLIAPAAPSQAKPVPDATPASALRVIAPSRPVALEGSGGGIVQPPVARSLAKVVQLRQVLAETRSGSKARELARYRKTIGETLDKLADQARRAERSMRGELARQHAEAELARQREVAQLRAIVREIQRRAGDRRQLELAANAAGFVEIDGVWLSADDAQVAQRLLDNHRATNRLIGAHRLETALFDRLAELERRAGELDAGDVDAEGGAP